MKLYEAVQKKLDTQIETEELLPNLRTWVLIISKFTERLEVSPSSCWHVGKNKRSMYVIHEGVKITVQLSRFAFYMYDSDLENLKEQYQKSKESKKFIRASCGDKFCCNPDHLIESFTPYDSKNSPSVPKGSACKKSKLTDEQVLEIRESILTLSALSEIYHVSRPALSNIKNGLSWKHLLPINKGEK